MTTTRKHRSTYDAAKAFYTDDIAAMTDRQLLDIIGGRMTLPGERRAAVLEAVRDLATDELVRRGHRFPEFAASWVVD
jgi:hypothetical protein